jgi:hypothetical protein
MALDRRFWLSGRSARGMLLRLLLVLLWEAMVARGTRRRPDLVVVTMGCGLMDVALAATRREMWPGREWEAMLARGADGGVAVEPRFPENVAEYVAEVCRMNRSLEEADRVESEA